VNVDAALRLGLRGLPGGESLARLLLRERGVRNPSLLPPLTREQILEWAEDHRRRTGDWPACTDGDVLAEPGEKWRNIDAALREGRRGLPGGDTLARLLARERGVRNHCALPDFSEDEVLSWARGHRERTGAWPHSDSGAIQEMPGETWASVERALRAGSRGFPGGDTLARLLDRRRRGG
jgi:hypothetical protein